MEIPERCPATRRGDADRRRRARAGCAGRDSRHGLGGACPPRGMHAEVAPRATGELDCNGLSPIQHAVKDNLACADPKGSIGGRFYENGHYIGHDDS